MDRSATMPKATPLFAKLVSKLVLEVLPASLASVIGAALLAHYQFGHPSLASGSAVAVAPAPASPEMLELVRDEHALIRNFLTAQQAAQANRYAKAEAPSVQGPTAAELAEAALRRTANAATAKTPAPHLKVAAAAAPVASAPVVSAPLVAAPAASAPGAAMPPVAPAPQELSAAAGLPNGVAPPAAPEHRSLIATILRVKDHVVHAPLHAVKAIGGIPSWIGHRLDSDEPDSNERMSSAAS